MKTKIFLIVAACVAAPICFPIGASAAEKENSSTPESSASPAASPAKLSMHRITYHGMVSEVDQTAKTFTIASKRSSRVFKITDKTAVTKDGKPATIVEIVTSTEVSGAYWKNPDGSLEAKTVKIGPMREKKTSPAASTSPSPSASTK